VKARTVQLGEVCDFVRGVTFSSGEGIDSPAENYVACLTTSGVQNEVAWKSRRFIPANRISNDRQLLRAGDILISTANSKELVGKSCIADYVPFKCTFGAFVTLARPKEKLLPRYLAYWMSSAPFLAWSYKYSSNTTNISNLRVSELEEMDLELPDLSEQLRIAGELERADGLRCTRRYALELADTFLPAAFLQLFGDPVANPRGWERAKVSELGDVETGNTPPRENADYYGDAIEWIKSDNISLAQIPPAKALEGLSEKGIAVGTVVEARSLLLTCIAGSEASIGNVVLTDRRVAFNQQINAVTPHQDVDPWFLYGLFLTAKPHIQRKTTLAMKRMITKGKLEDLIFIKPPLSLQTRFAELVERHERLRSVQRESMRQAEHLFQSLLHKTFNK